MLNPTLLSVITWDPPREAFSIPFFNIPVYWYGLFFAFGFILSYFYVTYEFERYLYLKFLPSDKNQVKKEAFKLSDSLALWLFIGMILGARLGHVFFYDWPYYSAHLSEIPLIREGGLSSHGGAIGVLLAFYCFWKKNKNSVRISWKKILDFLAIAACIAGGFIRIGNFFNQEILGKPSDLPWAVSFGHPVERVVGPCHPVQIYEALFYFLAALLLFLCSRTSKSAKRDGYIFGLFLITIFTFRFIIEWLKLPQESFYIPYVQMGQLLSIPFVGVGIYFISKKEKNQHDKN